MISEDEKMLLYLQHEPKLSNFYTPSDDQQVREFVWIMAGTIVVGYLVYKYA